MRIRTHSTAHSIHGSCPSCKTLLFKKNKPEEWDLIRPLGTGSYGSRFLVSCRQCRNYLVVSLEDHLPFSEHEDCRLIELVVSDTAAWLGGMLAIPSSDDIVRQSAKISELRPLAAQLIPQTNPIVEKIAEIVRPSMARQVATFILNASLIGGWFADAIENPATISEAVASISDFERDLLERLHGLFSETAKVFFQEDIFESLTLSSTGAHKYPLIFDPPGYSGVQQLYTPTLFCSRIFETLHLPTIQRPRHCSI